MQRLATWLGGAGITAGGPLFRQVLKDGATSGSAPPVASQQQPPPSRIAGGGRLAGTDHAGALRRAPACSTRHRRQDPLPGGPVKARTHQSSVVPSRSVAAGLASGCGSGFASGGSRRAASSVLRTGLAGADRLAASTGSRVARLLTAAARAAGIEGRNFASGGGTAGSGLQLGAGKSLPSRLTVLASP